ncbi:MAG: hypothetical protein GY760_12085, partial [Deltaproteobacteria bacterium]|nr:hypothetical protein [Deltaproteobacteria bacterium]
MKDLNINIFPVTAYQEALLLFSEINEGNISYNVINKFLISDNINLEKLENALNEVIARHEILRTIYLKTDSKYMQKV